MSRVLLLGFVVLAAACGDKGPPGSLCTDSLAAPTACNTPCNPAPGSANDCPLGYHCASTGKCDTQCTAGGNECGDGYACTLDGFCISRGGGGSGSGGPIIDADCPAVAVTATRSTPSIQILVDRSGSMLNDFNNRRRDDVPNPPAEKYQTVVDALVGTQGIVTQLQAQVYFGASMYPTNACPTILQSLRSLDNLAAIQTLLANNRPFSNDNQGIRNTPTHQAIDQVVTHFRDNPPPDASPPIIVLATDGLPNQCTDSTDSTQDESVAAARAAYAADIKLFILAVGTIADADKHLQDMANAGLGIQDGQPNARVFRGTDPAGLADAFNQIIGGVLSCDLRLDGEVAEGSESQGEVLLNGTRLTFGTDWTLDNDHITLRLIGQACETLKNTENARIDASFPCGTVTF